MTKRTVRSKTTRTKSRSLPRTARAKKVTAEPKQARTGLNPEQPATPESIAPADAQAKKAISELQSVEHMAAPKPETTFTFTEVCRLMGCNRGPLPAEGRQASPLDVAIDAIEELRDLIFVANEHVHGDASGIGNLLSAAWSRADATVDVLDKIRLGSREVQS